MDESESKNEKPKEERRFSPEQYEFLKECSEKGEEGIKEWNEWRKKHHDEDILLQGAKLEHMYLKGAFLNTSLNSGFSGDIYLEQAKLHGAHLEDADLSDANLQGAKFLGAHLNGVDVRYAHLQGADFSRAIVDGSTLIWRCKVDRKTKFEGVGLDAARIYPVTKQLLEYNIRRMNWEEWYKGHPRLKWFVKPFWWISDYGLRTWRIIATFFGLAIAFGVVYWLCPSCVMVNGVAGGIRGFWHALYFSVVTMTTLGFGDIAANPDSWGGQTLLMLQVILGYVLLGALVTRFAVLFTAGGPAGKFSKEKKK